MSTLLESHGGAIFDLDGVLYRGKQPVEHAAAVYARMRAARVPLIFLTNNASRTAAEVVAQLASVGVEAEEGQVLTSAMAAVKLAEARHGAGAKVLPIGGAGLIAALDASTLVRVGSADDAPEAVVHGFFPEVGWRDLSEAALAIQRGADYIATNLDATLPMERGFMVGQGSLVKAVVNATGAEPVSAGKPEPAIFRLGEHMLTGEHPLAIGDRLNTDIRGGVAAGVDTLHVLTGVSSARDVVLAVPEERPTYLGVDLRDLERPYAAPQRVEGAWALGGTRAWVSAEQGVELTEAGTPVALSEPLTEAQYRVLAAAAWEARDLSVASDALAAAIPELTVMSDDEEAPRE